MLAHTKKHPTDDGLVSLQFRVHPANVERIKRYVETVEPVAGDNDGITADEFFDKYFTGKSRWAVALCGYRTREGFTQRELTDKTGIPQRHISEMENGKRTIGKETARKLAAALNVDYRVFL
jgi:DNA-binding XRE family transcriptional regulator